MKLNSLQLQKHKYKLSSDSFKDEVNNNNSSESNIIYIVSFIFFVGYLLISALS